MTTWKQLEDFIAKHHLPYRVERMLEMAPCKLVDTFTEESVAYTLREAVKLVK